MMERLKNWLKQRFSGNDSPPAPDFRFFDVDPANSVKPHAQTPEATPEPENAGDGKNALIRNRYVREETGTHETLKILDDSIVDSGEETGIDPYNTGGFDRSKNWNNRFRK